MRRPFETVDQFEGVRVHTNRPRKAREEGSNSTNQTQSKRRLVMLKSLALTITLVAFAAGGIVYAQDTTTPPLTDAQIAMIAVVADTVDIDTGNMAAKKTKDKSVREFAKTMVRDHTAVNAQATALAKQLGVVPEESDISKSLKSGGDETMAHLMTLTGAAFDKAYIDNEVSYHEAVLGVLDKTLIPNTTNAELKSLLESARPIFVNHLEHAKKLQASMTK
jgi:putative membrane protein